jgi:hypothetical protein
VLAVEHGEPKMVVTAQFGLPPNPAYLGRPDQHSGLASLLDWSHQPPACPHQAPAEVEAGCATCTGSTFNGPRRIAHEHAAGIPESSALPGNRRCTASSVAMG